MATILEKPCENLIRTIYYLWLEAAMNATIDRPIRVLHVLEAIVGGTRRHLVSLLQGIDKKQFHVEVASPRIRHGKVADTSFLDEVFATKAPWHCIDMRREIHPLSDTSALAALDRLIKHGAYDIVHVHSSKAGILGRIAAWRHGCKTVYTPNGFYFLESQNHAKRLAFLNLERLAGRITDCLIAVSASELNAAIERRIVPAERTVLIPNAIDVDMFVHDDDANRMIRNELDIGTANPIVGTVSRYIAQKDPLTLVRAAQLVLTEQPQTIFVWCGEGDLRASTESLAQELGVHNSFRFLGFRKDVLAIMNCFDVFVLSSVFEGLPYTLLEAMAIGLPVVATDVVGNRDVVVDGITGRLVPARSPDHLAKAMVQLLDSDSLRRKFGDKGRELVCTKYDLKPMIERTEQLYRNLVGASKF